MFAGDSGKLTVTLDDVKPEEDGHEDENLPVHICSGAARVAGDGVPEGDGSEASGHDTSHSKHDAGSAEVGKVQTENLYIWVKWAPNLASFAAAFLLP